MAKFSRIEVFNKMVTTRLVPLFYHREKSVACLTAKACYNGGVKALEFVARGDNAIDVFIELINYRNSNCSEMAIGVGSITDGALASLYMQAGADFIVTPVFREDVARVCNRRKVLWSPGCGTLTEISKAEELGCELIKLFPGGAYDPSFVKSILAPCPWTNIMVTGGVTTDSRDLEKWLLNGVSCIGIGSNLIKKEFLDTRSFQELEKLVQNTISTLERL